MRCDVRNSHNKRTVQELVDGQATSNGQLCTKGRNSFDAWLENLHSGAMIVTSVIEAAR